jgi:hypothetical protein
MDVRIDVYVKLMTMRSDHSDLAPAERHGAVTSGCRDLGYESSLVAGEVCYRGRACW